MKMRGISSVAMTCVLGAGAYGGTFGGIEALAKGVPFMMIFSGVMGFISGVVANESGDERIPIPPFVKLDLVLIFIVAFIAACAGWYWTAGIYLIGEYARYAGIYKSE